MRFALLPVIACFACGARDPAPVDFGPPPQAIDPLACPASILERFATRVGAPLAITTEQIVDAARIDKVPCKPAEADDACIARARTRPVPTSYEVAGVTIGGDVTHVEFLYDIDGRRVTEHADTLDAMVKRLKALQAQGHKVTLIRGESAADAGSRHAAIAYRGVGGRQRRIANLKWKPDDPNRAMAEVQAAADRDLLEVRTMEATTEGEVVVVATCGAGSAQ
jgi:hypothetical protein